MNMADLRARLETITNNENIEEHLSAIESLKSELSHTIRLVQRADPATPRNCYEFAFGMNWELTHWIGSLGLPDLFVGPKFVTERLLPLLSPIEQSGLQDGDLVLYFDGDTPTHAELIKGTRVVSKWGKGHIYEHDIDEVPATYGSTSRYYSKMPDGVATRRFIEYVCSHPDYGAFQDLFEENFGHMLSPWGKKKGQAGLAPLSWTPHKGDTSPEEVSDGHATAMHQRVQARSGSALEILGPAGGGPRARAAAHPSVYVAAGTGGPWRGRVPRQRRARPQGR